MCARTTQPDGFSPPTLQEKNPTRSAAKGCDRRRSSNAFPRRERVTLKATLIVMPSGAAPIFLLGAEPRARYSMTTCTMCGLISCVASSLSLFRESVPIETDALRTRWCAAADRAGHRVFQTRRGASIRAEKCTQSRLRAFPARQGTYASSHPSRRLVSAFTLNLLAERG